MPLHLLGKKSWNVYNTDNIAKVRRDEAAAQEREAEEERRMQEVDAERRIQILRGIHTETPPPAATLEDSKEQEEGSGKRAYAPSERPAKKRRKLAGEDDTDRDIRLAKQHPQSALVQAEETAVAKSVNKSKATINAPITDQKGHINLFPMDERGSSGSRVAKNPEAEAEATKKKREFEDQYTMRFSNAAGFKQKLDKPWYSSLNKSNPSANGPKDDGEGEAVGKDVWGNENRGRRQREKARMESGDPLASMKSGIKRLKDVEKQKKTWADEREREIEELRQMEKRRRARRLRDDVDVLEDFSLDGGVALDTTGRNDGREDSERRRHRHHRRSRSRDHGKSPERHIHRRQEERALAKNHRHSSREEDWHHSQHRQHRRHHTVRSR
ncbi:MAG: hypothetical protein M1837_007169 [Sclerophora amabilis]|nr:MAG: hypothetical protein M1837_007169 [Sclerophora amabilis]